MARGYDVIGSKGKAIAIIEVRDGDAEAGLDKAIAERVMKSNKHIVSVLKKESAREGEFRMREYSLIAGDDNTEVLHMENGYKLLVDPQKAYFSNRESTERMRIASQVQPGEVVMVMFAGIGPYAIAIAKAQPNVEKVIAVEINSEAVRYMEHNIRINKLSHKIVPVQGDVRDMCEPWYGKCDRVVMPLPLGAGGFLNVAAKCAKHGAVVHLYGWGNEADGSLYAAVEKTIGEFAKMEGVKYEIIGRRRVLPYAPGRYKVCVEFKVL
jgi:tRNA (guanine37-N1)-methyltransferase